MEEINWSIEDSHNDWDAFSVLKDNRNYPLAAFHLQQSAEKALKALSLKHRRPGYTHGCTELCAKLKGYGVSVPEDIFKASRRLDPHYIDGRYPNGVGGPPASFYDKDIIQELEICTKKIKNFVDSRLKTDAG